MAVTFKPRIHWPKNDLLLPAEWYGVSVPAGVGGTDIRWPNFVTSTVMQQLGANNAASSKTPQLGTVEGRVTSELTVTFPDPATQWKKAPLMATQGQGAPHGPWKFEFTGGDVFLDLDLGIYILDKDQVDPNDDASVQIFALLYSHELLHVLDETNIVSSWLPANVGAEQTVADYLVHGKAFIYGLASSTNIEKDFSEFIGTMIATGIHNAWATEKNRRAAIRDTFQEYLDISNKVTSLRGKLKKAPTP